MKKEITLQSFLLLLFELLFYIMIVSRGGTTVYTPDEKLREVDGVSSNYSTSRQKEYFELPAWWESMKQSTANFQESASKAEGLRMAILALKSFVLFGFVSWVAFLLFTNTRFSGYHFELFFLIIIKTVIIMFFLLSGFLTILGDMKYDVFWEYGNITKLPTLGSYFTVRHFPMLLALVLGILNLVIIKFAETKKPAPPKPAPKASH